MISSVSQSLISQQVCSKLKINFPNNTCNPAFGKLLSTPASGQIYACASLAGEVLLWRDCMAVVVVSVWMRGGSGNIDLSLWLCPPTILLL